MDKMEPLYANSDSFMDKGEFSQKRKEFNRKPVDKLLDLLASEDLETRFFTEMALRNITGT